MQAAQDLIDLQDGLSEQERDTLKRSVKEIMTDTPQTAVGATRLKLFLSKATKAVAGPLRDILVDIASEAAKKALLGS